MQNEVAQNGVGLMRNLTWSKRNSRKQRLGLATASGFSAPWRSVVVTYGGPPVEVRGRMESRQLGGAPRPVDKAGKAMVSCGIDGEGEGAEVAAQCGAPRGSQGCSIYRGKLRRDA
jgi:hypothetical protein